MISPQVPESADNTAWAVDLTRWPLVSIRPPAAAVDGPTSEEFDRFCQSLAQLFARRRPFVVLYDVRGGNLSPARRQRMIDWASQYDDAIRTNMIALAVIVGSESERAHVTAGFWSLRRSYHASLFDDPQEAERWLLAEFARGEGCN